MQPPSLLYTCQHTRTRMLFANDEFLLHFEQKYIVDNDAWHQYAQALQLPNRLSISNDEIIRRLEILNSQVHPFTNSYMYEGAFVGCFKQLPHVLRTGQVAD